MFFSFISGKMVPDHVFDVLGMVVELSGRKDRAYKAHIGHRSSHQGGVSDIDAWR
jgi:hypothetical protein